MAMERDSRRKIKLLCSFGGRILPRPSDGSLRYAGGHTRIISVPREIPFPDLTARLADVHGGVSPTLVKYQLPNEDLDALISVSCPEDLDNMMEEYEKVLDSTSDGSAKLRVFLFSPADLSDPLSGPEDSGQRYFDAVNGVGNDGGSLGRMDSGGFSAASASSAHNSDGGEGMFSPESLLSPITASVSLMNPAMANSYVDPTQQVQFLTPQPVNAPPLMKPVQLPPHLEENYRSVQHGAPMATDLNYRMVQPLSQFPPIPQHLYQQQGLRFEDCHMCQTALPHAHSDPVVQDFGNLPSPMLYSQMSENVTRSRALNLVGAGSGGNVVEPKIENERPFVPRIDNADHARVFVPPNSMGISSDAQSSYGLFLGNFPQAQPSQNAGSPHYQAQQHPEGVQEYSYDYVKNVNEAVGLHRQGKADNSSVAAENYYGYMPQVGGNVMFPGRGFVNLGVVPDGNYARPINQMPAAMHNLQHPPIPSESLLGMPTYATGVHLGYGERPANPATVGDLKVELPQVYPNDALNHLTSPPAGDIPFGLSNAGSPSGLVEHYQEPVSSDSLFSNQDPRKILGGAHALPPRPKRVASKESMLSKDSVVEVHLGNSTEPDIIALLEEGGLHPSPDSLKKALQSTQPRKGDEQTKQDLQAVSEGVAASVLNPSSPPAPVFFGHETKELHPEVKDGRKIPKDNADSQKDKKPRDTNKTNSGHQITNDMGRLQIIYNSDLEELRELGSGTFGTVYHGKWRGTDVAIKRINDRCFAGKPSEKDRMISDFWNEACKLADLHHPNVVAFYGVVSDGPGGSIATVTEYMVNGSLRTCLQRNDKTLDRRKRLLIAMDVAFGMEYLHKKNIVHFDLKSDNLLVNLRDPQRPICKVGDLGLSKVKCQTLISGGVRGTLPWMAPELLNGGSSLVSEKVDVFSYGIVMWELLTGEEPYADLHYGAIIGGIVSNTLRPPVPESCDPHWRSLMEKCWSADPPERPSFTEITDRLRSMAASLPTKGQLQGQAQK